MLRIVNKIVTAQNCISSRYLPVYHVQVAAPRWCIPMWVSNWCKIRVKNIETSDVESFAGHIKTHQDTVEQFPQDIFTRFTRDPCTRISYKDFHKISIHETWTWGIRSPAPASQDAHRMFDQTVARARAYKTRRKRCEHIIHSSLLYLPEELLSVDTL